MAKTIYIEAVFDNVFLNIKQHLAVIGKRAKTADGKSLFSDINLSDNEKPVFFDLIEAGAEIVVSELADLSVGYVRDTNKLLFHFDNVRWDEENKWTDKDDYEQTIRTSTEALQSAINNYLYSYAVGEYLAMIHPSTGFKYPPLYGSTYLEHCNKILVSIRKMGFLKRPSDKRTKSYADISGAVVTPTT